MVVIAAFFCWCLLFADWCVCLSYLALAVIGAWCFVLASLLCLVFAAWCLALAASVLIVLGVCCLLLGTCLSFRCVVFLVCSLSFFWSLVLGTCLVLVCLSCLVHVSSGVSDVCFNLFFLRALERCGSGIMCDSFLFFVHARSVSVCLSVCLSVSLSVCVCVCVCVCALFFY